MAAPDDPNPSYLDDLALASACIAGDAAAWERFVATYRPILHRAADAIDPTGGARDLADTLFADLYGLGPDDQRQPLLRYYHGRSKLSTWLRAVLAQRHIDRLRATRRIDPIQDDEALGEAPSPHADPSRSRYVDAMQTALKIVVSALEPRDRLRLACYYRQDMTLAAIGRMLKEHEATVSRHLARSRREIRTAVEARLKEQFGMDDQAIAECFRSVAADAGTLDLAEIIDTGGNRKIPALDRSTG